MTQPDSAPGDLDPARRPITIYDIAQLAGASASSVSAVLNGTWKKRRISARLAEHITRIAEEQGYSINLQASLLRRDRSRIIGMIVPKYDNRYFGAIAEQFEGMARARGLFPVITCTQREPALEIEAAREMLAWRAECLIVTGATDPGRVGRICAAGAVRAINLDLPGIGAPSVVSDNFAGARDLTRLILTRMAQDFGARPALHFIGGRPHDHNTRERLRGFMAAHTEAGLAVPPGHVITRGYGAEKTEAAMSGIHLPDCAGLFVNSTIALEGLVRWLVSHRPPPQFRLGCFDWDPFGAFLPQNVGMVRQDVGAMLEKVFDFVETPPQGSPLVEIPCLLEPFPAARA